MGIYKMSPRGLLSSCYRRFLVVVLILCALRTSILFSQKKNRASCIPQELLVRSSAPDHRGQCSRDTILGATCRSPYQKYMPHQRRFMSEVVLPEGRDNQNAFNMRKSRELRGRRSSTDINDGSPTTDRQTLLAFKAAINVSPTDIFSTWDTTINPKFCSWQGVTCSNAERVTNLDLSNQNISGPINPILGNLTALVVLNLNSNQLSGNIPLELGHLTALQNLYLSSNNLAGSIPDTLGNLFNSLIAIDLSNNNFNGPIPSSFGNLFNRLLYINLSNNSLSGSLPQSITNAGNAEYLKVANNFLSGEIPNAFGSCQNLQLLSMENNNFQGGLPTSLQNCSQLTVFQLGGNELGGGLPAWLNNLSHLMRVFMIGSNNFTGVIPEWLSNFTNLQVLDISDNGFLGPIPASLNQLKSMLEPGQSLNGGTLLEEIVIHGKGQAIKFEYVLSTNTVLDLSHNEFVGDIPPQLGDLHGLIILDLSGNNLSGGIPTALANLKSLESLDLSSNQLSGTIPLQMVDLTFLEYLDLSSNNLAGPIPFSNQFVTFNASSFLHNLGLCGRPLSGSCSQQGPTVSNPSRGSSGQESFVEKWLALPALGIGALVGFVAFSSFLLPFAYISGKRSAIETTMLRRRQPYGLFKKL